MHCIFTPHSNEYMSIMHTSSKIKLLLIMYKAHVFNVPCVCVCMHTPICMYVYVHTSICGKEKENIHTYWEILHMVLTIHSQTEVK